MARLLRFSSVFFVLAVLLTAGTAMADTTVSWVAPADGSTYCVGTVLGSGQPSGAISGIAGAPGTGLDLMMVIDVSGSMAGTKLTAAKTATIALINSLPDDTTQVGLVKFDTTANTFKLLQDLTANKSALIAAVNNLTTGNLTATGLGIQAATNELLSARAIAGHAKMQVVLSDGAWNTGINPVTAAATAWTNGITVHTVGVPGHNATEMDNIATAGHGVYTNVTNLDDIEGIFDGTGGNLVNLDYVDIELPDGTWINDIATDGLGNFVLPDQVIQSGAQTFKAYAYGTDGTSAIATLTLNGKQCPDTPEPTTLVLLGAGLVGLTGLRKRRNK